MIKLIPILFLVMGFTGCTIRIVDDTEDYDISGSMKSADCEIEFNRIESKTSGSKRANTK